MKTHGRNTLLGRRDKMLDEKAAAMIEEGQNTRYAVRSMLNDYQSRLKFCDIEAHPYYREFTERLKKALGD
jgi:hypothetical protein